MRRACAKRHDALVAVLIVCHHHLKWHSARREEGPAPPFVAGLGALCIRRRVASFLFRRCCLHNIAAGGEHSLLLTEGGAVLSCGLGVRGQLGHGDKEPQCAPKVVAGVR